jgi:hypothetical protein
MGLKIRIGVNFLFRLLVLCLICAVPLLANPGLTHSASSANEHFAVSAGQGTMRAPQEGSEKGPGIDTSTESHYLSEIRMSLKTLHDQISALVQQQQEVSKVLGVAERRTFETKVRTLRFEWYFIIILVALVMIICIANIVLLSFIFRRRRYLVNALGITYEASSILAAVKDRQIEMASLINELKEQIEVLGYQSVTEVSSTFQKLAELLKSNEQSLVALNQEMGEGESGKDKG